MQAALALCRLVHYLAAMSLFGAQFYVWALAPPTLASALAPALRRIGAVAIPFAALSALAWLSLEAAAMAESWSALFDRATVGAVLSDTAFGAAWRWRLAVAGALLIALALRRDGASALMVGLAALLLASLALVGHATLGVGPAGLVHRAGDALHLIAAGGWLGGLPMFALSLAACREPSLRGAATRAMARFSFCGQFAVAGLIATGLVNFGFTSGWTIAAPLTPYRALLTAKLVLVAGMVGLALFNRLRLAPRLDADATAEPALRRNALIELALGAAVVALVSLFGLLDPS